MVFSQMSKTGMHFFPDDIVSMYVSNVRKKERKKHNLFGTRHDALKHNTNKSTHCYSTQARINYISIKVWRSLHHTHLKGIRTLV